MTDRYRKLAALAVQAAMEAPPRFSKYGYSAYVRRSLIAEIRAECDRLGIDWKPKKETRDGSK